MRKLGIAAKLYLAFGCIFLLAALASSIGWEGFTRVTDSQNSVIDQAIPGLRQAHQLSALNASIGADAQQLMRASDESERVRISSELFSEVGQVHALIDDFQRKGFSTGSLRSLRQTVRDIEEKLRQQDELVRRRIHQQARFSKLADGLIASTEELNYLADSLVANAASTTTAITSSLYDLVENDVSKQQLYEVFDRLVEVDLDAMERMYELRLRSANLNSLFNRVIKEFDLTELAGLRKLTVETISILKRRVSEINDPQRRQKATELLIAMEIDNGPLYVYSIFESRISLIQINQDLTKLSVETGEDSQALNEIVKELNATGSTLINRVSTTAKESLDTSRRLFGWISIALLVVAAAILWGFIKRNVVRRLSSLQAATQAITQGDYDIDIVVEGHDELTDMGKALRGFRNNAIQNRKLDEELREHKAHLEELVEERSEQLRETNQKLSEEAQNHAIAREKAEQASQAKTAFLATMSHELRTPLSGALGTLQLLSDTHLQAQQSDYVHIINAANTTLLDIVNDILGYSQLEAGKLKIEHRLFELTQLLDDVVGLMSVSVAEKNNRLALKIDDSGLRWLKGDSGKLQQILINLIGNANKFTDSGSIIVLVDTKPGRRPHSVALTFSVEDTGIGIAEEKQADIFQAFTQVDASSARRYGGIGLGLAICERLIGAMGGKVRLQSALGKGTKIEFDIEIDECGATPIALPGTSQKMPAMEPINVLMVEDDETNSMVTNHYLESLGHCVIIANTGESAISLLGEHDLSLVLLDISLPGIDGLEILKFIRSHHDPSISGLRVIAMSAHVFTEEVDQYLGAGMNGFLGKPFTIEQLGHAIAEVMSGSAVVIEKQTQAELIRFNATIINDDIDRLGQDTVEQFVTIFLQTSQQLKVDLIEASRHDDFDSVSKHAHKLLGASGNFGLEKLCECLSEIETQAKSAEAISTELIDACQKEYEAAINALVAHLSENSDRSSQRAVSLKIG